MDIDTGAIAYIPSTGARRVHDTPLLVASEASLAGYGYLVDDPHACKIEIVRWPAQGWRSIDANSGDQGGVAEGLFEFSWQGETLFARNNAVRSTPPKCASARSSGVPTIIPTAGSCSIRSTARASSCRWRCRATT
jgi:hypothetical protein